LQLLVQLHNNVSSLRVRLWPWRLSDGSIADNQNLQGFYLFGIASATPSPNSDEDRQLARRDNAKIMSALTTTLRAFESDIHQNSRYYDPVDAFVSVRYIGSSQLPSTVVHDTHRWSDNGFDNEDDSDDENDVTIEVIEAETSSISVHSSASKKHSKSKTTQHIPASKL
jgi:hypothetical protein